MGKKRRKLNSRKFQSLPQNKFFKNTTAVTVQENKVTVDPIVEEKNTHTIVEILPPVIETPKPKRTRTRTRRKETKKEIQASTPVETPKPKRTRTRRTATSRKKRTAKIEVKKEKSLTPKED